MIRSPYEDDGNDDIQFVSIMIWSPYEDDGNDPFDYLLLRKGGRNVF